MAGTAAHLSDCVLPAVPTRQYVLAVPYEISGLAATRPAVLTALSRIFWETVQRRYRRWLRSPGEVGAPVNTYAQRPGSRPVPTAFGARSTQVAQRTVLPGGYLVDVPLVVLLSRTGRGRVLHDIRVAAS